MAVAKVALRNAAEAEIFATYVAWTTTVVNETPAYDLDKARGLHLRHRSEMSDNKKIIGLHQINLPYSQINLLFSRSQVNHQYMHRLKSENITQLFYSHIVIFLSNYDFYQKLVKT